MHFLAVINQSECASFFSRNQGSGSSGSAGYGYGYMGAYGGGGQRFGSSYNYDGISNANGRDQVGKWNVQGLDNNGAQPLNGKLIDEKANVPKMARNSSGMSAWGLITIIMLVILFGMGGYYGIICYPLICKEERNYDIMDGASTTASANTPTRSSDFEKSGNYSSRSTTPSVIISTA